MDKCPLTGNPCHHKKYIHVIEVSNCQATEVKNLCVVCGVPYMSSEAGPDFNAGGSSPVFDMINSIIKNADIKSSKVILQPPVSTGCPTCGYTLEDFMMTGKLGCGDCYSFYNKELIPLIQKCQYSATQHVGKMPKQFNPGLIKNLETEMKIAIEKEDHELVLWMVKLCLWSELKVILLFWPV